MADATKRQVVSWNFPTYFDLGEWHRRVESLAGNTPRTKAGDTRTEFWDSLPQAEIERIAAETGATYLVSETNYDLPIAYQSGNAKVYEIR